MQPAQNQQPPYHALPPNAAWWAAAVLAMAPASAFAAELPQDATPAQVYGADEASGAAQPEGQAVELVIEGRRSSQTKVFRLDRSIHSTDQRRTAETQPESTAAATVQLPGAVGQMTNRGAGSPLLRGLIGPQNLIMIDGLRFNNATFRTGPNQYLAVIDLSAVDRMELLLGPGGVMYGSDAMGGVIGLHLPPLPRFGGADPPALRLWTQYGSADSTGAVGGQASWSRGPLALEAGGAWRDHGTLQTGEGSTARASDYRQWGWHARAALQLSDQWTLQGTVLQNAIEGAGRTDDLGKGLLRTYDNGDVFGWLEARRESSEGILRYLRVAAVAHRMTETGNNVRCTLQNKVVPSLDTCAAQALEVARETPAELPAAVTRQDELQDAVTTVGALATARLSLLDNDLQLTTGAEAWFDRVESSARQRLHTASPTSWKPLGRGNYSDGSTYAQLGLYGHADYTAWRGANWLAVLNGGARAGWVQAAADAVPSVGDARFSLPILAATAGAVLNRQDQLAIFANFSTGLRAPNLQETTVLGNTGDQFEVPNATLQAERIAAVELGVRVRALGFSGQVAGFYSAVSDFIDRETVKAADYPSYAIDAAKLGCAALGDAKCQGVSRRVNLGTATIAGTEVTLRTPSVAGVQAWLAGTYLQGESTANDLTQPLRRLPPANGSAGLRWASADKALYAEPWIRAAATQSELNSGDTKDLRICENPAVPGTVLPAGTCRGTPGWATVNLRAGYRWNAQLVALRAMRIDVDAGNLLDVRYRLHGSGIDAPGRGVTATLTGEW